MVAAAAAALIRTIATLNVLSFTYITSFRRKGMR